MTQPWGRVGRVAVTGLASDPLISIDLRSAGARAKVEPLAGSDCRCCRLRGMTASPYASVAPPGPAPASMLRLLTGAHSAGWPFIAASAAAVHCPLSTVRCPLSAVHCPQPSFSGPRPVAARRSRGRRLGTGATALPVASRPSEDSTDLRAMTFRQRVTAVRLASSGLVSRGIRPCISCSAVVNAGSSCSCTVWASRPRCFIMPGSSCSGRRPPLARPGQIRCPLDRFRRSS